MQDWTKLARPLVVLAPMVDVTTSAFREVCRGLGADATFSEMIVADAVLHAWPKLKHSIETAPAARPYIVQLTGSTAEKVVAAAEVIVAAVAPDGLDLNMGCPAKTAVRGRYGSCLLENPAEAISMIAALVERFPELPISIKIRRIGKGEVEPTVAFCRQAEAAGVALITIHGRTRNEHYETPADWSLVAAVKQAVNIPVLANGDLMTPELVLDCLRQTGADGVMIARGAIGNPWIFSRAKALLNGQEEPLPIWPEQVATMLRHAELYERYDGERAILPFRKQLSKYAAAGKAPKALREQLVRAASFAEVEQLLSTSLKV